MSRNEQAPLYVATPGDNLNDGITKHPAYGMIVASRVSGSADLFGSSVSTDGMVMITIREADMHHSHGHDTPMANKVVTEIYLTEAQWVGLISRMAIGSGVPCTFRQKREGPALPVPQIPPQPSAAERLRRRAQDMLDKSQAKLDEAFAEAKAELAASGLSKAKQAAILSPMSRMNDHGQANRSYQTEVLRENTEKLVTEAKVELQAHASSVVTALGIQQLQQGGPITLPRISIDREDATDA